jgi:AhpD family alkylhydroperoxidase
MASRLDYRLAAPEPFEALMAITRQLKAGRLAGKLIELVFLRCSQLNGCAHCVDNHARALRALGESDERLDCLLVWRDTPFFDPRERAALAFAEATTRLGEEGVPEPVWAEARAVFDDTELAELAFAIVVIDAWNRLSIAFAHGPEGRG